MGYMETFQSRIHREWSDVSGFLVQYLDKAYKGFAFQHNADEEVQRTHTHSYHFNSIILRKSYSEQVGKKLSLKGQTEYWTSCNAGKKELAKPLDISGAWCYGSKWGTIAPKYLKNISPDEVEGLQKYARSRATVGNIRGDTPTEVVIIKEITVKVKPTQYQHAKTCATRILETYPEVVRESPETRAENMKKIFAVAYAYFRESGLYMGKYKQLDFLDMVLVIIDSPDYMNRLQNAFMKRHEIISQYEV